MNDFDPEDLLTFDLSSGSTEVNNTEIISNRY